MAKKETYQIKVFLIDSNPKIWRRILVASDTKLSDLHTILQIAMGWTDSHLHQFIKDDIFYSANMEDDEFWDDYNNIDYAEIVVSSLLKKEKDTMIYEYDFGDGWEHEILLEKILPFDETQSLPLCIMGEMSCPPEDCGGVWGYAEMLEILKEPEHEEYQNYMEWLGTEYLDPTEFSIDEVNEMFEDNKP